jgi:hypothetical protein
VLARAFALRLIEQHVAFASGAVLEWGSEHGITPCVSGKPRSVDILPDFGSFDSILYTAWLNHD